jgi:hypothetical protein
MKLTIFAASLAALMASAPVMAREPAHEAFRGAHAQATRSHVHAAPAPYYSFPACEDPGAHLGCPPAPVHDNTPPPS